MRNLELGNETEKDVFQPCHERGTKGKMLEPPSESDLRIPGSNALPLSHSTVSKQKVV